MHKANVKSARLRLAFIVCLLMVSFPFYACADVLFGESYHEAIHKYLKKADTSITIAMYFIILEPEGEGPINELINDIVDAKNRGVQVKIVLENSKLKVC